MERPLRVGLIGCGNISVRSHAPVLRRLPIAEVVGVADPVAAARAEVLAQLERPDTGAT